MSLYGRIVEELEIEDDATTPEGCSDNQGLPIEGSSSRSKKQCAIGSKTPVTSRSSQPNGHSNV